MTTVSTRSTFSWRWIAGYAALALAVIAVGLSVRINHTPSLPRGVYLQIPVGTRPLGPGDDVFACMPVGDAARLAVERDYVEASPRHCASGGVPLLKHVLAARGDTVVLTKAGVFVQGAQVGFAPRRRDRYGRLLEPVYGRWPLGAGDLWLGSDIPNGYDSRYLGPVSSSLVLGRARLVLRFDETH